MESEVVVLNRTVRKSCWHELWAKIQNRLEVEVRGSLRHSWVECVPGRGKAKDLKLMYA